MLTTTHLQPVDYLVIGHVSQDLTPNGTMLGGTASYSSLTARTLGLRVGILTSHAPGVNLSELDGIQIVNIPAEASTTFENVITPQGRVQHLYHVASKLDLWAVPEVWRRTPIVHLGPIAQETEPALARAFPDSLLGLTPQGWLRTWDADGRVFPTEWPEASFVLGYAGAAVISVEDVQGDESRIEEMAAAVRILAVTEGANGARLYWNGDVRRFRPPTFTEVDPVGAGDIFAAGFFHRLHTTRDPWEAARFATHLAAYSVTRRGLKGIPTQAEVLESLVEVLS